MYVPFPSFKPLEIEDKETIEEFIKAYSPFTSEWTFTNLFMWRKHYGFMWSILDETLLIISKREGREISGFQPIGVRSRKTVLTFFEWLKWEGKAEIPRIERADKKFIREIGDLKGVVISPTRDHFDYVYLREDLVQLKGNRYRTQRNKISKALRSHPFQFQILSGERINECVEVHRIWCEKRGCEKDPDLSAELEAVYEMFSNYEKLGLIGGVILLKEKVVAFSVGEMLNEETMVVHAEKADLSYKGLYALINQKFAEVCARDAIYINREQDLGIEGLRRAKTSYHPHHMVEKYLVEMHL